MNCEECTQKMLELPVERFVELKGHLDTCAECRGKAERIKVTVAEHQRILAEDAKLPPVGDDGVILDTEGTPGVVGLTGFSQVSAGSRGKGGFLKLVAVALILTAIVAVFLLPRVLKRAAEDKTPKPSMTEVMAVLGGKPTDISAPTAPARVTIVPIIIEAGRKIRAPSSLPPRTWVWFGLNATQNANVDLCMTWPGSVQPIWSGYLKPGRTEVPPEGYVMDITGQYTFSLSRTGDGSCKDLEGEIKLEVQP